MTPASSKFPARYEPIDRLGEGGSGEVWAARDRVTGHRVALKLLREKADPAEIMALVREASALSGIEGLGVPRVLHFGRLPQSGRVYLVRELVEGRSLADLIEHKHDARVCIAALIQAADQLTSLHRSLLLHGDIKPANIIVGADGRATLVDLGLAAPWREGGTRPEGLTPRYAAPELFRGEALTPQGEVYALGASLDEILVQCGAHLSTRHMAAARVVARRATAEMAADRHPSVDEFAEALRSAVQFDDSNVDAGSGALRHSPHVRRVWTIVGGDGVASALLERIGSMRSGEGLFLVGPEGAGRTTVLRRVAWSLGVSGSTVAFIESADPGTVALALDASATTERAEEVVVLVDDVEAMAEADLERIDALRVRGARVVMVTTGARVAAGLPGADAFTALEMPSLEDADAVRLIRRFMPSIGDRLVAQVLARSGGYPGPLRALVERLESRAVVSEDDLDSASGGGPRSTGERVALEEIHRLLDRGRLDLAAEHLDAHREDLSVSLAVARGKVANGRGDPKAALLALQAAEHLLPAAGTRDVVAWHGQKARAHLRAGDHEQAGVHAERALALLGVDSTSDVDALAAAGEFDASVDALAVAGLAQSLSGRSERAMDTLERSVALARHAGDPRILAIALGSLAFALQKIDRLSDAEVAHLEALSLAEQAGDAGSVATTRLNLATIAHSRGDLAGALTHLEATVDMGRRSGRAATVRQALFNLASLDLYLGRQARAQASLDALALERESLSAAARAQLLGLEAESFGLAGDVELGAQKFLASAEAYQQLNRPIDAAEALLERVLVLGSDPAIDPVALHDDLVAAEALLGDSGVHQAVVGLARGRVAVIEGRLADARTAFDEALVAAERAGRRDWVWRTLVARADLDALDGNIALEAEDRRRALEIVNAIAAPLPRDLRDVFWSDPRRRALRDARAIGRPVSSGGSPPSSGFGNRRTTVGAPTDPNAATQFAAPARDDRMAMLLEINRELAGEHDLDRLLERVTDRAVTMLDAERGFVLLRSRSGEDRLSVHAMRDRSGDEPHAVFSRSIAERVLGSGEPFLAVDATSDDRVSDFVSVHQLMLRSVACVPIRARTGTPIGALYLETRLRTGTSFSSELPTLMALAEQVAIAIETARLVNENQARALELEAANRELEAARARLEELLGRRTEQLQETRRSLRTARAALRSHFGYGEIVGTSPAMRQVYAVIDRVKDADIPVLITGESGTGKEVVARTMHAMGPRAKQKFVGVNCGALPEHLLESELFGHVRGAFTGADRERKGLFREVEGGTILLDEVGEMPPKMQATLLRVLQEKVVRPVGGTKEEPINVRVIAATHRDLPAMVRSGGFREDLFYRLNVIELRMPALRERREDVPLLVDHFLRMFAVRYGRDRRSVGREALRLLQLHDWPGNVRQLENVLLNAWILSDANELLPAHFDMPSVVRASRRGPSEGASSATPSASDPVAVRDGKPESIEDYNEQERQDILEALRRSGWNRAEAARALGMARRTFYRRLARYGIR